MCICFNQKAHSQLHFHTLSTCAACYDLLIVTERQTQSDVNGRHCLVDDRSPVVPQITTNKLVFDHRIHFGYMDSMVDSIRWQNLTAMRNQLHSTLHDGYISVLDTIRSTFQNLITRTSYYHEIAVESATTSSSTSVVHEDDLRRNTRQEEGQGCKEDELAFLHTRTGFFWVAREFLGAVAKLYTEV
jgi:hypothetical protein